MYVAAFLYELNWTFDSFLNQRVNNFQTQLIFFVPMIQPAGFHANLAVEVLQL